MRPIRGSYWAWLLAATTCLGCSGSSQDELDTERDDDGGGIDSGSMQEDGGPLPDGSLTGDLDAGGMDAGELPDGAAGSDAGDAGDPDLIVNGLYVSPSGVDTNPGTELSPFLTIAQAATMAQAGDTIVLLDGVYDSTTQPTFTQFNNQRIQLADGVSVRALHPGAVTLRGLSGALFEFMGSGTLRGLVVDRFSVAVMASAGELRVVDTKFLNGGSNSGWPLQLTGTVHAVVTPPTDGQYIGGTTHVGYARVQGDARLEVMGGTFSGAVTTGVTCNGLFHVGGNGQLTIDGATLRNNVQDAVVSSENARITIRDTVIENTVGTCQGTINMIGMVTLRLERSRLTGTTGTAILARNQNAVANVTLIDTTIAQNAYGMWFDFTDNVDVTARGSHIDDNTRDGVHNRGQGGIDFDNCTVERNGESGLELTHVGESFVYDIKLRNTSVRNNNRAGLRVQGSSLSTIDLGTFADPGNNVLRDNKNPTNPIMGVGYANLVSVMPSGFRVLAVGNTWDASTQGTNAAGRYEVPVGGTNVLEYTGSVNTGVNYQLTAGSIVRMAQTSP